MLFGNSNFLLTESPNIILSLNKGLTLFHSDGFFPYILIQ